MGRLKSIMEAIGRYGPILWIGVKALWAMRQAKKRQEWFREALIEEGDRRARAEADVDLARKLNQPFGQRMSRIRAAAAAISRAARVRGDGGDPKGGSD